MSTDKTDGGVTIYWGNVPILHCSLFQGKEGVGSSSGSSYVQLGGYYASMIHGSYHEHFVCNSSVPVLGLEVVGNMFRSALAPLTLTLSQHAGP